MRSGYAICFFFLGALLTACSGGASSDGSNNNPGHPAQPHPPDAVPANYSASNMPVSNAQPQSPANRFDLLKRRRLGHNGVGPASNSPLEFRPGPENSETATKMNDQGQAVEERIFKDHAQLDRVEAVWLGETQKLLRITFKNGQTVEVKTDQIPALATASSELLVQLGGGPK